MYAVNLPGILNLVLLLVRHLSAPEITTSTMITRSKELPTPPATPPTKAALSVGSEVESEAVVAFSVATTYYVTYYTKVAQCRVKWKIASKWYGFW